MSAEAAETARLGPLLARLGEGLDRFLRFEHPDALQSPLPWRARLDTAPPQHGIGADAVAELLLGDVVPHGSAVPRPGFCGFITTGAASVAALAGTAAAVASPQRYGHTAFSFLEELSLRWLAQIFGLGAMEGVYSSGGSVANLLALGAARQRAFERIGIDPAAAGVDRPVAVYASAETHHTVQRAAGVLGLGRRAVRAVRCDPAGRIDLAALEAAIAADRRAGVLPLAVVGNAGTTNTGAIDPLAALGSVARREGLWFHVDGAYGLPGRLDERIAPLYDGLAAADSVVVDAHKWLGAAVGIGATFVQDRALLQRAFTQEPASYLEGSMHAAPVHSMEDFGVPSYDFGVELSAPCRGVVVWALLQEIGIDGLRARVRRHRDMAAAVAHRARVHPALELLCEPTLSVVCFRYAPRGVADLDALNAQVHRQLLRENRHMPSTTRVAGRLALRPCFIGARTGPEQAAGLVDDVLRIGHALAGAAAAAG